MAEPAGAEARGGGPRIVPGAEPFRFDAGHTGALLLHGFTGSPASMRPMGEWLAARGISTLGPRLPGHGTYWMDLEGTTWRDWADEAEAALSDLRSRCREVIVAGLSMGGAMALHVTARNQEHVRGVAVVNADVRRPLLALAPVVRLLRRTVKGVGNDIKKHGQDEVAYDRIPVRSLTHLNRLYRTVRGELPSIRVPLLVFSAPEDHVVKPSNSRYVIGRAGSAQKVLVELPNSYHVATLDHDAETIFERVLAFAVSVTTRAPTAS